ncbi:MAG TPA: glucuronate isomerase [Chitinophagaceae bacterium]|nr:glucuronate isomerase [Chitinophagaceae bacterium]
MSKGIYHSDFLLTTPLGKTLYHEVAAALPIIDPHNHLDPTVLAKNEPFAGIYELWVQNDPYKHRAMRICGVEEALITGQRSAYEKFKAWAACYPATLGNPLYDWCQMELATVFNIKETLSPASCQHIYDAANEYLQQQALSPLNLLQNFGVEMLCTSDDLLDSLAPHAALQSMQGLPQCLPSLRADNILAVDQPGFYTWLQQLTAITAIPIKQLDDYKAAIHHRLDFFDRSGCLLSDHSLDSGFTYRSTESSTAAQLFARVLLQQALTAEELTQLQSHLLQFLGEAYAARHWGMQLHIGAYRYTSSVLREKLGPAGGYACIGHTVDVASLCKFLDDLDKEGALPKTILYTLNPADNAVLASVTGSYAQDGMRGKIQYGPAWWYNDHFEGITEQLKALSSYGLLSTSIGMTTDSRSLLSFVRHDYYRRILCNYVGRQVAEGRLPEDEIMLGDMVKKICYDNAKHWLKK